MKGNHCDPSYLRVRELWVQVVVCSIIDQMCSTSCQVRVLVGWDNECTCESLIFLIIKKQIERFIMYDVCHLASAHCLGKLFCTPCRFPAHIRSGAHLWGKRERERERERERYV